MKGMGKGRSAIILSGRILNEIVSFIVFSLLDLVDFTLCFVYKVADFFIEAEWKPCYCSSTKEAITASGKILVSEKGESKIVCLNSSKLQLEEISDTLYVRPSFVSEVSRFTVDELKKLKVEGIISTNNNNNNNVGMIKKGRGTSSKTTYTINSAIVEMLRDKIRGTKSHLSPTPRWSDCDCKFCNSWTSSCKDTLFVKTLEPIGEAKEDVLFIHGFISSSAFWTETLFPNFSKTTRSNYRLMAIDLLGFGRSPKPTDSLYTLREHIEMIEKSVIEPYNVKSFHIVAHSLGCLLALALAVRHPGSIKSLTLLAPPYYPVPKGVQATQHVMKKVAPRRVWPPIAFGSSIACWYEHISRTICLVICKNHRLWEFLAKLVTRNRIRTYLLEGFFCHTHNAAWHTLHNIICGVGAKLDTYLDKVDNLKCRITIFHGEDDELIPVECSYNVQKRIPRARVKVIENEDHITIVVGRQQAFARELEEVWRKS
ncbi:hypothetical protein ACFE04_014843 [Oxalis oulophora]